MVYIYKNSLSTFVGRNIPAGCIQIDEETYNRLVDGELMWENDVIIPNPNYQELLIQRENERNIGILKQEQTDILKWLSDNDYIINKHTLGEYTDTSEKWVNYLNERRIKLARYNELDTLIQESD